MIFIQSLFYFSFAVFLVFADLIGFYLPRDVSMALCVLFGGMGMLFDVRIGGLSLMSRFVLLSYLATIAPFFEFWLPGRKELSPPGRITYGITEDPELGAFVLQQYLLGLVVILLGVLLYRCFVIGEKAPDLIMHMRKSRRSNPANRRYIVEPLPMFWFLACLGVIFVWYGLVIPRGTILSGTYIDVRANPGLVPQLAFTGVTPIFHLGLAYLFVDAFSTPKWRSGRTLKIVSLAFVLFMIVVVFDLMRGNRSTAGLVLIIGVLFLTIPTFDQLRNRLRGYVRQNRKKIILCGVGAVFAFVVFTSLPVIRRTLHTGEVSIAETMQPLRNVHLTGSWMGGVYGSFAMAENYKDKIEPLEKGRDYLNLLLSLPPSPVARLFQYARPIDLGDKPSAWYERYAKGGVHPTLVPYRNFGSVGIFFHFMAYGFLLAWVENRYRGRTVFSILLYCAFLEGGFRWMWYGDLNLIRPLMAAVIVYIGFLVVRKISNTDSVILER